MPINKGSGGGGAPSPARSSSTSPSSIPAGPVQWDIPSGIFSRRVVFMDVWGDTDTGRTSLALTAPGPIALIHANEKVDVVEDVKARGVDVRTFNFGGTIEGDNPDDIAANAMPLWLQFTRVVADAFTWARTIIIDTHTEAWELERIAYFGGFKPEGGRTDFNYGPLNFEWKRLFARRFRAQDRTNLILIGQSTAEYTETSGSKMGKATGKTIWSGQKQTKFMVDVRVRMSRDSEGGFVATIEKGWNNAASEGVEFKDKRAQFAKIMGLVTKTDEGEWK